MGSELCVLLVMLFLYLQGYKVLLLHAEVIDYKYYSINFNSKQEHNNALVTNNTTCIQQMKYSSFIWCHNTYI